MTPTLLNSAPARLVRTTRLTAAAVTQTFYHPYIARLGKPGQFIQIQTTPGIEPFFRRPMSIYHTAPKRGWFSVLFATVGTGTRLLSRLKKGDEISIVGPLGNTFCRSPGRKRAVLVAGGVGLPPLHFWARHLAARKRNRPAEIILLIGSRSMADRLRVPRIPGVRSYPATDDGSIGHHGTVIDLLKKLADKSGWSAADTAVYGCGPTPMLKALQEWIIRGGYWGQVSLEEMMPCGFGVCSGCAVPARPARDGYDRYLRVCHDGPVFSAAEVQL